MLPLGLRIIKLEYYIKYLDLKDDLKSVMLQILNSFADFY